MIEAKWFVGPMPPPRLSENLNALYKVPFCLVYTLHQGYALRQACGYGGGQGAPSPVGMTRTYALGGELVMLASVVKHVHRYFFQMPTFYQNWYLGPIFWSLFAAFFMSDTVVIVLPVSISASGILGVRR